MPSASAAKPVVLTVGFTTFVDFSVAGTGTKRLSTVRRAKAFYLEDPDTYVPRDYYLPLKWATRSFFEHGDTNELDRCVRMCPDNRRVNYSDNANGLRKWAKGQDITWVGATKQLWHGPGLDVRVSPEVGVLIGGEPWIIKLHFKLEQATKRLLDPALHILDTTHGSHGNVGILDVRRGALHKVTRKVPGIDVILAADAVSFVHFWNSV